MRFLLLPFSWIYSLVIFIRNKLYDIGILESNSVNRSIGIGNLSMGGTGKTPLTQYLAQWLIENKQAVYILSRGYKRSTDQNILVKESHLSHEVGDEPLMYKKRFKSKINVLVSKNRWLGSLDAKKIIPTHLFFSTISIKIAKSLQISPSSPLHLTIYLLMTWYCPQEG